MVKRESRETGQIEDEITFTRRQIREFTGWPDYQIKTYIKQPEDLEYLILQQVKTRGQFEYRLNDPNQPKTLKGLLTPEELKKLLSSQKASVTTGTTGRNGLSAGQSQARQDLAATGTEKVKNLESRKKRGPKPKISPKPSVTIGTTGRNGLSASQSQE
jgi:hypothetical protein